MTLKSKKKRKIKIGFKGYFEPTPKRIRILGDSLVASATFASSVAILNGHALTGTIIMIVGVVGKFISNFFHE